jgi:hypothetical protein
MLPSRVSSPARTRDWHIGGALAFACVLLACVLTGMLVAPTTAHAEIPVIGPIAKAVGSAGEVILNPGEAVLKALLKILQAIFGGLEAKLITGVIRALLSVPSFQRGHVATLEHTTVAIAAGMLSAVLTLSIIRYYLAGLTDSGTGGFEAVQGIVRVAGAVGFIILWPGIFAELAKVPQVFNAALLGSESVQHNVALLFDAALVLGASAFVIGTGVGLIFVILIALAAALIFIALLWMKILIAILLMFLYVSMPLAVVLWPVPELAWVAGSALRTLSVALLVPCVWAILFALSAAINADILTWVPTHSILNTLLVRPLAGLTLMVLCITIPRALMQAAIPARVPHPAGTVWRTLTLGMFAYRGGGALAHSVAGAAAEGNERAQGMIARLPTSMQPPRGSGEGSFGGRLVFGRSGYEGSDRRGRRPTPGRGEDGTATFEGSAGAEEAIARSEQQTSVAGVERPQRDAALTARAREAMRARSQIAPPAASDVTAAMGKFSPETQQDLARLGTKHGLREYAAQHLRSPSLSDEQRDALNTLGSARMQTLHEGINVAQAHLQQQEQSATGAPTQRPVPNASGNDSPGSPVAEQPPGAQRASTASSDTGASSGPLISEPPTSDPSSPIGASPSATSAGPRSRGGGGSAAPSSPPAADQPSMPAAPGSPTPGEIGQPAASRGTPQRPRSAPSSQAPAGDLPSTPSGRQEPPPSEPEPFLE